MALCSTVSQAKEDCTKKAHANIRPHGYCCRKKGPCRWAIARLSTVRGGLALASGVHGKGDRDRRSLWTAVRRVDRLSGTARRPHGQRLDPDCRAGDFGPQEA